MVSQTPRGVRKFRPAIFNDGDKSKDGIDVAKTPSRSKGIGLQSHSRSSSGQDVQSGRVYGFIENGVFTTQKMPALALKASNSLSSSKRRSPDSISSDNHLHTSPDKKLKREFMQGSSKGVYEWKASGEKKVKIGSKRRP